jgi:hypothetical protein
VLKQPVREFLSVGELAQVAEDRLSRPEVVPLRQLHVLDECFADIPEQDLFGLLRDMWSRAAMNCRRPHLAVEPVGPVGIGEMLFSGEAQEGPSKRESKPLLVLGFNPEQRLEGEKEKEQRLGSTPTISTLGGSGSQTRSAEVHVVVPCGSVRGNSDTVLPVGDLWLASWP